MQNKLIQQSIAYISTIINTHHYTKPVLQLPKSLLSYSFDLVANLRKLCEPGVQFYVLYDSMKKQCCTDIIGARHVDHDVLFHIGYACFSEKVNVNDRYHYILPEHQWQDLDNILKQPQFTQSIKQNNIKLILCDQSLYKQVMAHKQYLYKQVGVQIGRLVFDRDEHDQYFGFGYYCGENVVPCNILVIKPDSTLPHTLLQSCNPTCELLLENLYLCSKSLHITSIFTLTPTDFMNQYLPSNNKRLMQRLSQISELPNHTTFGILVSNPSTKFCQYQIKRCRQILDSKGLKHFTFMMNNLNQCKLGNFPEIEVYVVISCYNYSLYGIKDFYRLVVAPYDLQVAFADASYENYQFDLNLQSHSNPPPNIPKQQQQQQEEQKQIKQISNKLTKINNELSVQNMIQTLDFYRHRQYKGLQFKQKKQVQKIKLGKIGIASQYKPLKQ